MSEHELWNELGNLYFLSGSYDQAIHAYTRSVSLDKGSGRSYSNMATAYVQKGKYGEAIILYKRGLKLLTDDREKALTWYKLGNVYRTLKEYELATNAYHQADELTLDMFPVAGSEHDADILLNCKPINGETFHFVDQAQDEPFLEKVNTEPPPTATANLETHPFIEELTPWQFNEQTAPEEDQVSFDHETWSMEITGNFETEDSVIFKEPLKWEVFRSNESSFGNRESQEVIHTDEATSPSKIFDGNVTGMWLPQPLSPVSNYRSNDVQATVMEQQALEVETMVAEEEPDHVIVIAQEPESVTPVPEFMVEHMTDPEAVQYETQVEPLTVELTKGERRVILFDIDKYKRILEINPQNAFAWDTLGGRYKALGEYEEAINAFQKAVSLDSSKAHYFHHLGLVYAAVERFDDAIAAFELVIEIDPNHSLAHATLGGYYRKKGKDELAQEYIEKARSLLDADENEYNRACMEAICGNSERALELLEVALKNKQTYVNWARRDPDFDFIRSDPRFHTLLATYAKKST